ncbi:hypothetical protein ACJX0J_019254, partial [Zea mays]
SMTRLVKVAFVAFDFFCGAYINNYLCRVHTITVQLADFYQIFLCYYINFGLYHNYLCRVRTIPVECVEDDDAR